MLKATVSNQTWLVQQHHHAQVSGFLAAHWGGVHGFARPGHFPGATSPAKWREEVILGIAEHDNGWWEWEAMPSISLQDGLPVGVGEAASPTLENEFAEWRSGGFDRWRLGIQRLADSRPYAALLTSLHAYWLYAVAFEDLHTDDADAFRHPVFGPPDVAAGLVGDEAGTRSFLEEQARLQCSLVERLVQHDGWGASVEREHLHPHVRLLQLLDSMSLFLALNDPKTHTLHDVPRSSWADRDTIRWSRPSARTGQMDPYPFDMDPLIVHLPLRQLPTDHHPETPFALLHGTPLRTVEFKLTSPPQ